MFQHSAHTQKSISDVSKEWFTLGKWGKMANELGNTRAVLPKDAETEINKPND